ncbi:MAG: PilZ domain-containing protein [Syntrophales bacterium]
MDREKRKRSRVPVQLDIGIALGEKLIKVQIINISLTGILCTSNRLFRKDAPCKVVISLRDDLRIAVDAKILRAGERETAISFISMDEESFAHLKRIVQYNADDADRIDEEFQYKAFD